MEYRNVKSSSLTRVGYEAENNTLEVTFTSGRVYEYDGVPKEVANGLLNAKSKGAYLAETIVGKYTYRCLNPPVPKEPSAPKLKAKKTKTRRIQPI